MKTHHYPIAPLAILLLGSLLAACSSTPTRTEPPAPPSAAESTEPDLMQELKQRMAAPVQRKTHEEERVVEQHDSQSTYVPVVPSASPPVQAHEATAAPVPGNDDIKPAHGTIAKSPMPVEAQAPTPAPELPPVPPAISNAYDNALQAMRENRLDEALHLFEDISLHASQYSGPLVNQGLIYLKMDKFAEAEKVLHAAVHINDRNPYAWNHLGIALRGEGKFAEAKTAYLKALELDDKYARAHFNLAVLADLYLQDLPLALEHYQKYQALQTKADVAVGNWIIDLQKRTGTWKPPAPAVAPATPPTSGAAPVQTASGNAPVKS